MTMKTYAKVQNGKVSEIVRTDSPTPEMVECNKPIYINGQRYSGSVPKIDYEWTGEHFMFKKASDQQIEFESRYRRAPRTEGPAVEEIPEDLTRLQFFTGIRFYDWNGNPLEPQILGVIDALPEPNKTVARTKFEEAIFFRRNDTMLIQLAGALGMGISDLNEFFEFARNINN